MKDAVQIITIAMLVPVLLFLAENVLEEIKKYETPDYADVAGCRADLYYDWLDCG